MLHTAVALYTALPGLPTHEFKRRLEASVGPLPRDVYLPSNTLSELYKKVRGRPLNTSAAGGLGRGRGEQG
jgi:hypothetical protein